MLILNNGDILRGNASIVDVIDYTVHGLVGDVLSRFADGQLPVVESDLYPATNTVVITSIVLVNTDIVSRTVNLYIQPDGEPSRHIITKDLNLNAGASLHYDGIKVDIMGQINDGRYYTESEIDTISGSLSAEIDFDISTHSSSGDHDDRYYTETEVDDLITTISGKLDDHDELNNLDYASSGHTGFQPAGDYLTDTEFTTYSGTLQTQVDGKSDTSHLHDDRYYTEVEVNDLLTTLSGVIDLAVAATRVCNTTGATLTKGTAVTICGMSGALCCVCKSDNREFTKMPTCGVVDTDVANGAEGNMIRIGKIDLDTSGMVGNEGERIYVQGDGSIDTTIPTSGSVQRVGFLIVKAEAGTVCICIRGRKSIYAAKDEHPILRMGSDAGHKKIVFKDYTDNEVAALDSYGNLTLSGTVDEVDIAIFKSDYDSHEHDDRYYTETEVDDLITTVSGRLDDHNEMNNLDYASSGHIGFASSDTLSMASATELTIVSGTVTRTQTLHRVDTEGNDATDDLDTILGGTDGDIIIVRAENGTRTVTLKDGTGNLKLGGRDLELLDTNMAVMLFYSEILSQWLLVGDGGGSATVAVSDDAFSPAWDGGTAVAPSRNAVYDIMVTKSDASHLHDDRYYTETEVDTLISTFSGTNTVGLLNDAWVQIDDIDAADNDYARFTASGIEGRNYSEVLEDLSGQATAAFDWNDQIISRPEIKDYSETRTIPSSSSNVLTLDIENGSAFEVTLTENVTTLNFNNPSSSGTACSFDLFLIQDSTPRTVVWPDSIIAEATPDISTASAKYDFAFITMDAGTTWRMYLAGSEMASL